MDAAGPDIYCFDDLVRLIARSIRSRALLVPTHTSIALWLLKVVGVLVKDVVLTEDELGALWADLLVSDEPPRGHIRFRDWLESHREQLGKRYASEMVRHFR